MQLLVESMENSKYLRDKLLTLFIQSKNPILKNLADRILVLVNNANIGDSYEEWSILVAKLLNNLQNILESDIPEENRLAVKEIRKIILEYKLRKIAYAILESQLSTDTFDKIKNVNMANTPATYFCKLVERSPLFIPFSSFMTDLGDEITSEIDKSQLAVIHSNISRINKALRDAGITESEIVIINKSKSGYALEFGGSHNLEQ